MGAAGRGGGAGGWLAGAGDAAGPQVGAKMAVGHRVGVAMEVARKAPSSGPFAPLFWMGLLQNSVLHEPYSEFRIQNEQPWNQFWASALRNSDY